MPASPLALMDDNSPEAWLGNFLAILEVAGSARFSTIAGSRHDATLMHRLDEIAESSRLHEPMRLLDEGYSQNLKGQNWGEWWRLEGELGRYCYSVMSLNLLGRHVYRPDIAAMYRQSANARIHKDAHYVLCRLLGKSWPGYNVTEADLSRVAAQES